MLGDHTESAGATWTRYPEKRSPLRSGIQPSADLTGMSTAEESTGRSIRCSPPGKGGPDRFRDPKRGFCCNLSGGLCVLSSDS